MSYDEMLCTWFKMGVLSMPSVLIQMMWMLYVICIDSNWSMMDAICMISNSKHEMYYVMF